MIAQNYKKDGDVHYKGWGCEYWLHNEEGKYCLKILSFDAGKECSLHFHRRKEETFFVLSGLFEFVWVDIFTGESRSSVLKKGDYVSIRTCQPHQLKCVSSGEIVEASTYHQDGDSYRIKPGDSQKSPCHKPS